MAVFQVLNIIHALDIFESGLRNDDLTTFSAHFFRFESVSQCGSDSEELPSLKRATDVEQGAGSEPDADLDTQGGDFRQYLKVIHLLLNIQRAVDCLPDGVLVSLVFLLLRLV